MRAVPPELDPAVVGQIDDRLASVERDHGARVLWAIESGSRAWGFPSPDSDYDCRFIYVRPVDDYLSLWPMDLPTLLAESDAGDDVRAATATLIAAKAVTRELGTGNPPEVLTRFVEGELSRGEQFEEASSHRPVSEVRAIADEYFRAAIRSFADG